MVRVGHSLRGERGNPMAATFGKAGHGRPGARTIQVSNPLKHDIRADRGNGAAGRQQLGAMTFDGSQRREHASSFVDFLLGRGTQHY
jgi:hypothetical protein